MEREIDLRPLFRMLARRWLLILGVIIASLLLAAAIRVLRPAESRARARADLFIAPTTSQVTLDPRFPERDTSLITNATLQRQALVDLATSATLERRVAKALSDAGALSAEQLAPGVLLAQITVRSQSDLLQVIANGSTDADALRLAETWALTFQGLVAELYRGSSVGAVNIEQQLEEAQDRYDVAQRELEDFLGQARIVEVRQRSQRLEKLLEGTLEAQQGLYTQYLSRTVELDLILEDAHTLREQASADSAGSSATFAENLAVLALQARVAGGAQLPVDLRIDNGESLSQDRAQLVANLELLITTLERERARMLATTEEMAQAITSGEGYSLGFTAADRSRYEAELAAANREVEALTSNEELLKQRRDIALSSLDVLQRKRDEQQISQTTPQADVRFVGVSNLPPASATTELIITAGLGLVIGVILSGIAVAAAELRRRQLGGRVATAPASTVRRSSADALKE